MRVFVTGATGFIGSAIVRELLGAGHRVLGLARSEESAQALVAAGAEAHRGDLKDLESLRSGAVASEGVIHTAFIHDFSQFKENCETDRRAIAALGAAIAGSDRPLIVTSGTGLVSPGRLAMEDDAPAASSAEMPRIASEEAALTAAAEGARVSVVRVPLVHGEGDRGFVPMLIHIAREKGVSAYVGDGRSRWPAVHRLDIGRLYRLALENGLPGVRYHAVAEEGVPGREIAEVIGRRLNVAVVSKSPEEAADHFGWLALFLSGDGPASSARTREQLGWQPSQPGLIADLNGPHYFH